MTPAHPHAHVGAAAASLEVRRSQSRRRMWAALAINLALLAATFVGGLATGSLALLADAGHLVSDVGAIALGLVGAGLASMSGGARRTFGLHRTEVLAALVNGVALVAIGVLVIVAAIDRLDDPPAVEGVGVLALGLVGLAGNVAASLVLFRGPREDINLEAVLRHSVADALGSLAVVVTGAVVLATDWHPIDPIASLLIAALILASSWRLVREPLDVLMESAPAGIEVEAVGAAMLGIDGVREVHELHVWTVTSGFDALAAHVVVRLGADRDRVRRELEYLLRDRFRIEHTTLQMEEEADPAPIQVR